MPPIRIPLAAVLSTQEQKQAEKLLVTQFLKILRLGIANIRKSTEGETPK